MEKRLRNGEMIELTNGVDCVTIWFQEKTNNFCLELNAKVIMATKSFAPIRGKMHDIGNLNETI